MFSFSLKLKNLLNGLRKHKYSYSLCLFLIIIWVWTQTGVTNTITVIAKDKFCYGYFDNQIIGKTECGLEEINNIEINFEGNLPKPSPFPPEILSIKTLNSSGSTEFLCRKNCQSNFRYNLSSTNKVDLEVKNSLFNQVIFNEDINHYYSFFVRLFRERGSEIVYHDQEEAKVIISNWRRLNLSAKDSIKYLLMILLKPFPLVLVIFFLVLLLKKELPEHLWWKRRVFTKKKSLLFIKQITLTLLFLGFFISLTWVNVKYVEKIPHDPDSVGYYWAAKYLAVGKLWLPIPSDFFKEHFEINNHWVIIHPHGHPLLLAIGVIFGLPWIIPPLVGTLFLFFMYKIISQIINKEIALATIVIAFFSPQFQMHAATFMSHNTAIFYIAVFVYLLQNMAREKGGKLACFLAGMVYCLFYQTRPFIAIALVPAVSIVIVSLIKTQKVKLKHVIFLLSGFLLSLTIVFASNYLTYHSFIKTAYNQISLPKFTWGGSGLTISHGLTDSISYLITLSLVSLPGMPLLFSSLILISLFNQKHKHILFLCLFSIVLITLSIATYDDPWGLFLGARFWHEMLPFLLILISVALDLIAGFFNQMIISKIIIAFFVTVVYIRSISGWWLGKQKLWENLIYFTPNTIQELKGFNFTDARLIKKAKEMKLKNVIIFVKDCGRWWCYGSVADENSINLNGNIIWAHDLGERNKELIKIYPNRGTFIADYNLGSIETYKAE